MRISSPTDSPPKQSSLVLLPAVLLACLLVGSPHEVDAIQQSDSRIEGTDSLLRAGHSGKPGMWPTFGGDLSQRRFSPLEQIDRRNVADLRPAWIYQTGMAATLEAAPVVVGGNMYLTTPAKDSVQYVVKLDARTGRQLWRTALRYAPGVGIGLSSGPNRGAAFYRGKVYVLTRDARLVALSAKDGSVLWDVDTGAPWQSHAPLAYDGRIVVGSSGTYHGIRGFFRAFDAETGEQLWTWHTIPSPDEGGWWGEWKEHLPGRPSISLNRDIEAERADSAEHADAWKQGGGASWMTPTLDPELGLLYVPIAHPWPLFNGRVRPGDNRWSDSVCALRLDDGQKEWCYQYLPHDIWDQAEVSPPFLFELERNGESIPAVGHFSGLGILYVWDRRDGTLLTMSDNYVPHENLFDPPTPEGTRMAPGPWGGTEWSPGAYNPETGYAYSANRHQPGRYILEEEPREEQRPGQWKYSTFKKIPGEQWGNVAAVDPASGEVAWKFRTTKPMIGGVLTTAGGLVFAGRQTATFDAWNAATGEHLWQFQTGAGCASPPVTYRLNGRQYVVVACGGHLLEESRKGGAVIAFALP